MVLCGFSKSEYQGYIECLLHTIYQNNRKYIRKNIKSYIKDEGYTIISFAKLTDIPLEDLKDILNENSNNEDLFNLHIDKILEVMKMTKDELLHYEAKYDFNKLNLLEPQEDFDKIEEVMCNVICENDKCKSTQGVSCKECLRSASQQILDNNKEREE